MARQDQAAFDIVLSGEIIADHRVELREDVLRGEHGSVSREGRDEHWGDKRDDSDSAPQLRRSERQAHFRKPL